MPQKKTQKMKAEKARQYLCGTVPFNEDSEDELSLENYTWEWINEHGQIVGARRGTFECRHGDTLLLKAGRNESWVALLCDFFEQPTCDADDETVKMATFMWFSSPNEIRNRAKRRTDTLQNELYITTDLDSNPLDTITGKALVLSHESYISKHPVRRDARNSRSHGKIVVCRRGCNTRTATYTEAFIWEDVYRGAGDIGALRERIANETKATRKRKPTLESAATADEHAFVGYGDDELYDAPETPRKKRKLDTGGTPRSKRVQSGTPQKGTTPKDKRIVTKKPLEFTPLKTRVVSTGQVFSSPFQVARSNLHVSSVPTSLPCREEEFSTVHTYLESAITEGTGSCIYISGTPGTGKTATVREVIAQLNASVQTEELDDFIYIEINGMKVTDPHQSYSLLWEALTGERLSPTHALGLLEREFSTPSPRRVPCVVLMDELDQLVTRSQSVMYNFFNWPAMRHSRLIVLAVANTMDLPERTLSNKISSRLGLTRINFPVYTHDQLIKIIQSRLEDVPGKIVDQDAIQFASRKVAQVSGDARRALDICRRAVEIAESEARGTDLTLLTPSKKSIVNAHSPIKGGGGGCGRVKIVTIQQAIREATTSPLQQYLRYLPLSSKVLLASLLARSRRTGISESSVGEAVDEAKRIGAISQLIPVHDFLLRREPSLHGDIKLKAARIVAMGEAAMTLMEGGILMLETNTTNRTSRVRLSIGDEEVRLALKDDVEARGLGFAV